MNVGGLCPLKIKQSWVIQEKKILFFLHFQFEHQFFGRIFMLFLILRATNMVKLLISFPTPCLWVSHPTKIYFCLRTVLSFSLCSLWKYLHTHEQMMGHRSTHIPQCGFYFIGIFLRYTLVTHSCLGTAKGPWVFPYLQTYSMFSRGYISLDFKIILKAACS